MKYYLVADIGGTNTRIGLLANEGSCKITDIAFFENQDFPGIEAVFHHYFKQYPLVSPPKKACIAVASPVQSDRVSFVNNPWTFSREGLKSEFSFDVLHVINDFEAIARSLPYLDPKGLRCVGGGVANPLRARAVVGPGTGLGMGGLIPTATGTIPLASEGGHAAFAPQNEDEDAVVHYLRQRLDFVCNEDLLSGAGLIHIFNALSHRAGHEVSVSDPALISGGALKGDSRCVAALTCFCGILGSVAGDFALQIGAEGGVAIAGGIVPRFIEFFEQSPFRQRFEAKGCYRDYMAAIPTYVIMESQPGLIGAASIFYDEIGRRAL
ncbi:MAG: glucokinase [Chitinophagaceae bacterium]|nr:glucokinase [Oligoflexus sp.]